MTIAVAKKPGSNAADITGAEIRQRLHALQGVVIPPACTWRSPATTARPPPTRRTS
ncbi:hypothetical protein [Rhodanobacter lindaniclasticus]